MELKAELSDVKKQLNEMNKKLEEQRKTVEELQRRDVVKILLDAYSKLQKERPELLKFLEEYEE